MGLLNAEATNGAMHTKILTSLLIMFFVRKYFLSFFPYDCPVFFSMAFFYPLVHQPGHARDYT